MKKLILGLLSVLFLVFPSCKKDGACHLKNGKSFSETREAGKIDTITVFNNVHVIITTAKDYALRVEAEENLLPFIETTIQNGKLSIRNHNKCNFIRKTPDIKVFVEVPALAAIENMGSGSISSTNTLKSSYFGLYNYGMGDTDISMETDFMYVHSKGGGDVKLKGKADKYIINFSNTGMVYSDGFIAKELLMTSTATGDAYIHASEAMDVSILNKGDIYYKGEPVKLKKSISGEGRLVKL